MKTSTDAVRALLPKKELAAIELLEIYQYSPFTGTPDHAYCRYDTTVSWNSNTYKPLIYTRDPMSWSAGSMDQRLTFHLDNTNRELSQYLFTHELSGARIRCIMVFASLLTDTASYIPIFDGQIASAGADEMTFNIDAVSWLTRYGQTFVPRRIYQRQCNYRLGEAACTAGNAGATGPVLTIAANVQTSTTLTGSTASAIVDTTLAATTAGLAAALTPVPATALYWDEGYVEFTTGNNKGQARPLLRFDDTNGIVYLRFPFLNDPAIGDTYKIHRGCRKTKDDCFQKFNNILNFGGFTEIPPEKITV